MQNLIVVGAGPAGSSLVYHCSKNDVLLLEEHQSAGNKACSGLVSGRLKELVPRKILKSDGVFNNTIKSALVHVMSKDIQLKKEGPAAYVIDRDVLDKRLVECAMDNGAKIRYNEKIINVKVSKDKVKLISRKHTYETKTVVGCDGVNSVIRRSMNEKAPEILNGIIAIENSENYDDIVELWFDKNIVNDGFLWKIPRGETTEYGAMGKGIKFSLIDKFFKLGKKNIVKRFASPIPIGHIKTFSNRLLLVGDSACQSKPWSGGGVIYGMISAKIAAETIRKALKENDFSESMFLNYQKGWEKILLNDIKAGLAFRELYNDIDPEDLEVLVDLLPVSSDMQKKIDFDFPYSSALKDSLSFLLES